MTGTRDSLRPIPGADRPARRHFVLRQELTLALLPTATVLVMLILLDQFSQPRLLFASLASSAFLIYLDPLHATNKVRTLVLAHLSAAALGLGTFVVLGHGYPAAGAALIGTILLMILADIVHPPAVSTSLMFAVRPGAENEFVLFLVALGIIGLLVLLQRAAIWTMRRFQRESA